jgi:multidrug resistance efflux pump
LKIRQKPHFMTGQVTEVPIEPNRPIKTGDVLFKIDPGPFKLAVKAAEAKWEGAKGALVTAQASERGLEEQIRNAAAKKAAIQLPQVLPEQGRQHAFESSAGWT